MKLIRQVIRGLLRKPKLTNEITALMVAGHIDDAINHARELDSLSVSDWQNICLAATEMGMESEPLLFLALRKAGSNYSLLLAVGRWLARHGNLLRAYVFFSAAHRLAPAESAPLVAQGEIHCALENYQSAVTMLNAGLQRSEDDSSALASLRLATQQGKLPPQKAPPVIIDESESIKYAASLTMLGRHEEALRTCRSLLASEPHHPKLLALAAESAAKTGHHDLAAELYEKLVKDEPNTDPRILSNYGNSLAQLERYDEALAPLKKAVTLAPDLIEARLNLSYSLYYAGQTLLASSQLEEALKIEHNDFEVRWFRAHLLLADHHFAEGWQNYEFRWLQASVAPRILPFPLWHNQDLSGKNIVVTAEQGIGDQIMFASCIPELLTCAKNVIIECEPRLVPLFSRSFPGTQVVAESKSLVPEWAAALTDIDYYVPMGSLPAHFRPTIDSFNKAHSPYLITDNSAVAYFTEKLAQLGRGLKVGIAWRGGGALSRTRTRTLPLQQLITNLLNAECHFISLQYGHCNDEIATTKHELGIELHHWPETLADLDMFAALTAAVDLVITVCSAPVHFAGALGKPALVLVPYAAEWRYAGHDEHMLWYPSITLLRQPIPGDWQPALEHLKARFWDICSKQATPDVTN